MSLNAATLKSSMKAAILAAIAVFENPPDDNRLTGYTTDEYWDAVCGAISSTVVSHIQSNGQATGLDSGGDSHTLTIV